mmetsp:Transcript_68744/g.109083  ORF Transcript_68744/g.109083 Transcript_68744/m.109083 type:complete len:229 (+) Transcript_68744:49-735(+)
MWSMEQSAVTIVSGDSTTHSSNDLQAGDSKLSWADMTDAEFKSMGLTAADLLKDPFKRSVDRDARSTEAPSSYVGSGECSSNSGNEASDAEQEHGYKRRPMQFCPNPWMAQSVFPCGPQVQMIAVQVVPYAFEQPMQYAMPCVVQEDWSEMGPWAPYAYQAGYECPGAQGWWPSHLQCLPESGDARAREQPTDVGSNQLEKALAKARFSACIHQRALNRIKQSPIAAC